LATRARVEAWHIQALLPPHIAEESDPKMDEMEAQMTAAEREIASDLDSIGKSGSLAGDTDFELAKESFAHYVETKKKILALSRANTNVRSLALSLHDKVRVTIACEDALAALERSIADEPVPGQPAPTNPRRE